jgi:tryptophanyl-tRNA synthetase
MAESSTTTRQPMRYLSGVQSSGRLHLGNYFGAVQHHINLQTQGECLYFIANYHSLTTIHDGEQLRKFTFDIAADYLALGLDPQHALLFRQSDIPAVTELSWILSSVTGMGLLERAHSYKDKLTKGIVPNVGLFTYPILMAADILIYQSDKVPVGMDQVQHVEMARDIAGYFNQQFQKTVFKLPETLLSSTPKVVGLTGGKMSKSDDKSVLPILGDSSEIKKRIMSIVTDSKGVHDPKDPDQNPIFLLYQLLATPVEVQEMRAGFEHGGLGYGEAKQRLFLKMEEIFGGSIRTRRAELEKHPDWVEDVLVESAKKADLIARATMEQVYQVTGLRSWKIK